MDRLAKCWMILALLGVVLAGPAPAQLGHGMLGPKDRPLHERVDLAHAIALGSVQSAGTGRIQIDSASALSGRTGVAFEIKRAPSNPPSLAPGQRALLLLRGARSPYVLVDEPIELVLLDDAQAERRWRAAILELLSQRRDPQQLRDLYTRWCDGPEDDLRRAGLRGLMDAQAFEFDSAWVAGRVALVQDMSRSFDARRAAATLAVRHPESLSALVQHVASAGHTEDPVIAGMVLQTGLARGAAGSEALLADFLSSPSSERRAAAIRLARSWGGPELDPQLEKIAQEDPDESLRSQAERTLRARRVRSQR